MSEEYEFDLDLEVEVDKPIDVTPKLPAIPFGEAFEPAVGASKTGRPLRISGELSFLTSDEAVELFGFGKVLEPVQKLYIAAFVSKGTKTGAMRLSGVTKTQLKKWEKSEDFLEALNAAREMVVDLLEEELMRRAMDGSDKLLLEALKAKNKAYQAKTQNDVNITGQVVHSWAELAKMASKEPMMEELEVVEEDE